MTNSYQKRRVEDVPFHPPESLSVFRAAWQVGHGESSPLGTYKKVDRLVSPASFSLSPSQSFSALTPLPLKDNSR
ncbi:hypothetical protein CEXT_714091 [Caerostris extrusa]|uniref:Uncharacterized protein n=1 Tax=Caerostris extrusa TaxID=172846 RepID=A0AAV4N601_CAEEX|nr:hypothetical protein CEXT_714091 [Caerostris extrusa]